MMVMARERVSAPVSVGHNKAEAVPVDQLQPIRTLGSEHINRAVKGFVTQVALHQCRQPIMPLTKVDGTGRHEYLHPGPWMDHSAVTISAMRSAAVEASSRITRSPLMISSVPEHPAPTGTSAGTVDLSRFDAAPLIASTATKETNYGTETHR